ncbi:DoxX family protein [Paraburkholderia sp. SIMBA_055]
MTIIRSITSLMNPALLADRLQRWSPLPLRVIVGYGFMAHGYAKIIKDPEHFAAILHALNVPAPHLMAWMTIVIELLGGFAVLVGAFIPLVTIPMIIVLLVATFTVHLPFGFTSIKLMTVTSAGPQFGPPGYETDLLYLACLMALVFGGAGPLAIDNLLPWGQARLPSPAFGTSADSSTR